MSTDGDRPTGAPEAGTGKPAGAASGSVAVGVPRLPAVRQAKADAAAAVSVLAVRTDVLCVNAVDAWEITAGLEAEGINDTMARATYGYPDVFALADELYRRVPRRPVPGSTAENPWHSKTLHHLLRGVLFGLPGICYVGASQSLTSAAAMGTVVVSLLLSWSAGEALSYVGYARLGALDRAGAKRILRRGLLMLATLAVLATVAVATTLGADRLSMGFGAGQAIYVLAATVVLVLGAEWWLLAALMPGVAGSGYYLAFGSDDAVTPLVWAGGGATVLATMALALTLTARQGSAAHRRLTALEVRGALPHAGFGLLAGGLITFAAVSALIGPGLATNRGLSGGPVALPLSLSMGVAEWILFRYRRRTHSWLLAAGSLRRFSLRARGVLVGAVAGYLTVLATVAFFIGWAGRHGWGFALTTTLFWTSVLLGGALFLSLALRSSGVTIAVLVFMAAALAAEIAARWLAPLVPSLAPYVIRYGDVETIQLMAFSALFGSLMIYAVVVLGRVTRHR